MSIEYMEESCGFYVQEKRQYCERLPSFLWPSIFPSSFHKKGFMKDNIKLYWLDAGHIYTFWKNMIYRGQEERCTSLKSSFLLLKK
jgi:hypothetical protein